MLSISMALTLPLVGATFDVDNLADDPNALQCTPAPLDCSLRGAVRAANLTPGPPHSILLPAGQFQLTVAGVGEDDALTGDLDIKASVVIEGAGELETFIHTNFLDRVFDIHSAIDVEIRHLRGLFGGNVDSGGLIRVGSGSDVTLQDSVWQGGSAIQEGGLIHCLPIGQLSLVNSDLITGDTNNGFGGLISADRCSVSIDGGVLAEGTAGFFSDTGLGGAIYFDGPDDTLSIVNSRLSLNRASADGGAIYIASGTAQITTSTLVMNRAGDFQFACGTGFDRGRGGGLWVGEFATVTLDRTELAINCADLTGGGAEVQGSLNLDASTVRCNRTTGNGGGLNLFNAVSTVSAINTTFSQNRASTGSAIRANGSELELTNSTFASQQGDGRSVWNNQADVTTVNTVFADSCGGATPGVITSLGGNVEGIGAACLPTPQPSDQTIDPELGAIGSFGGPTQTHLPMQGSPVIGAGEEAHCPAKDQRGVLRSDCDAGSVEWQPTESSPFYTNDMECDGLDQWSSTAP